jgi:RNA polymerase sigma-70 factor (ECF subfamily)
VPDAELDVSDFDAVFRRFAPYVARIGARLLGPSGDIDDLVQDVFLSAHRGLHGLRDTATLRGWLGVIAVRTARRRIRERRFWSFLGARSGLETECLVDESATPEERARVAAVYRVLDGVSADARIAWLLRCVEGEPLERIAELTGTSRATAHRRVRDAQAALAEAFRDE